VESNPESDVVFVNDKHCHIVKNGNELRVISYSLKNMRFACAIDSNSGFDVCYPSILNFKEEVLEGAGLFSMFPPEVQEQIREKAKELKIFKPVSNGEPRRRRQPNPSHAGLPKKLKCSVCQQLKGTTPEQFLKQVAKSGKTQEEFIDSYVCRSCRKKVRGDE